jgi:hypothetical protein
MRVAAYQFAHTNIGAGPFVRQLLQGVSSGRRQARLPDDLPLVGT